MILDFNFISEEPDCGVLIYDRKTDELLKKMPFTEEERIGHLYHKSVSDLKADEISYLYYKGESILPDEKAKGYLLQQEFGTKVKLSSRKAVFRKDHFNWSDDKRPQIPFQKAVLYTMHVRGFTAHGTSGVKHPGTFMGIAEKVNYLKEIGVTTLVLQPCYEFIEFEENEEKKPGQALKQEQERVNYWGYTKGFYYAPKANYAADEDASKEFKTMVKKLHHNGIEVVMQFYFPEEVNRGDITDILRFWLLEYHVDGFQLIGSNLPVDMIGKDALLADSKLLFEHFDAPKKNAFPHLAECNDTYLFDMRKFLKGDDNMMLSVLQHFKHISPKCDAVHFLTNYNGFTLCDLVSYDQKHNEENGEENRDGCVYNASWNCGEEGPTKSRKIVKLRQQQIRNAISFLLLTPNAPMIFMGDEFGNSQFGNNNPYCQDNEITWLDWSIAKKGNKILEFWKQMIGFRKDHPVLTPATEYTGMDTRSVGYPDISFHGESAWKAQTEGHIRHAGIMYCGLYADKADAKDDFLYLALNMHWEKHTLALPKLPKGMHWEMEISTEGTEVPIEDMTIDCPPRTVLVYRGKADQTVTKAKKGKGNE